MSPAAAATRSPSQPRERALCGLHEAARLSLVDGDELGRLARDDGAVDAIELMAHRRFLLRGPLADVALGFDRVSERDVDARVGATAVFVSDRDRDDDRLAGHARDFGAAASKPERASRRRDLAPLGEDPDETPWAVEELGGEPHRAGAVARIVEVHAERAHLREEGEATQVRRVHHRVGVDAEDAHAKVQDEERIPPRRVIRHDQDGVLGREAPHLVDAADVHRAERATNTAVRVAHEPAREQRALARWNQRPLGSAAP